MTVGKGKTVGDEKAGRWERQYFELEAEIEDESALELAKGSLESLLDMWLKGETVSGSVNVEQKPLTWKAETSSGLKRKVRVDLMNVQRMRTALISKR
jgi:hypothetical protein